MNDVGVLEAAHHVGDRIGFTNIGEELVAQTFTLGSASDQAGDVHEFHGGRENTLRFDDLGEFVQPWIGHRDQSRVRFNGAEREILCRNACFGQRIEQGGFAHIGETYYAAFETHAVYSWFCRCHYRW